MAHFSAFGDFGFAVEVEFDVGAFEILLPDEDVVADQIMHGDIGRTFGGAQRQTSDGTDELFELAGAGGIHRPVAGIMRAWGHFIKQHFAFAGNKKFDREYAD